MGGHMIYYHYTYLKNTKFLNEYAHNICSTSITSTTPFLPPDLPSLLDSRGTIWEYLKINKFNQSRWCLTVCMCISYASEYNQDSSSNKPTCTHGHESAMRMRSVLELSQHCVYSNPSVFSLGFPGQDLRGAYADHTSWSHSI